MSVVSELIEAIEADPRDEASQLVIADYLQAEGDPRGDLIVLDYAERRGMLDDPLALDQLARLAAEYSFPRAEPDDPPLPFEKHVAPLRYEVVHGQHRYTLQHGDLIVAPLEQPDDPDEDGRIHHRLRIGIRAPYSDDEARVILTILSDVIRTNAPIEDVRWPFDGFLPHYPGSPLRCFVLPVDFLIAHDVLRNRYGLAVRDYHRWHAIWKRLRAMQRR